MRPCSFIRLLLLLSHAGCAHHNRGAVVDVRGRPVADAQVANETTLSTTRGEKEEAVAEALIRQRVDDWTKAIRAKDIDAVMSLYAPHIVSFDLDPPLRYAGTDSKRRAWQEFFAVHTGLITYEVRELGVTTHGELAFVHSLNHVSGMLASGHNSDMWVRWTACFRRIDGVWLVVHDHVSVPADLEHGHAVTNLTP
jgi:ketosteroid isomerase-like protein